MAKIAKKEKPQEMDKGNLAVYAALFVLFATMLDARFAAGISVGLLIAYAAYNYLKK